MLDLFNLPTPQGCDIQTFHVGSILASENSYRSWSKPRGVSNVYMMLIGGGGNGSAATGGGSGAVTVWYGSAQNVPDNLILRVGFPSNNTEIYYRGRTGLITLLTAVSGATSVAGTATAANQFSASGFYQSVAGQAGSTISQPASATTFLSGGIDTTGVITANYGYTTNAAGYFQLQPIIVGVGSVGSSNVQGGIGCGGSRQSKGSPGLILIASW